MAHAEALNVNTGQGLSQMFDFVIWNTSSDAIILISPTS